MASRRVSSRPVQTQTIVVAAPQAKPWMVSPDEVSILKNAVCKGATDEELKFCLLVASRYQLDPFQQQIWFVPRWDSQAEVSEGERGSKIYVPVVGINGLQHVAARDHADYGSVSQPEYGPMIDVSFRKNGKGSEMKFKAPEWARVRVLKKGAVEPTVGEVWWEEIYKSVDYAPLVRRMPRLMLAKCARAQAIRIAYPKTGGLLIPEETHGREFTQFTPEGRIMHAAPQVDPELWCKKHDCHISKCPSDGHTTKENEEMDARLQREKLTPAQKEVVDQKVAQAKAQQASRVPATGQQNSTQPAKGQEATKQPGATAPANPAGHRRTTPAQEPNSGTGVPKAEIPGELYPVKGEVEMIFSKDKAMKPLTTKKGSPFRKVVVGGAMYYVFDNKEKPIDGDRKMRVFEMLDGAKAGDPIEFLGQTTETDKGTMRNLMVLLRIGDYEWEPNGVPVLRYNRELFPAKATKREPGDEDIVY